LHSIKHWTYRYIIDRTAEKIYRRQNPDLPWLTPWAVEFLSTWLKPTDIGLEFGSGRSTIWFAKRVSNLISVEHDPKWFAEIACRLAELQLTNVRYLNHPSNRLENGEGSPYVQVAADQADSSLDFVLVDGIYRGICARLSIPKLKSGGILIIDNVNHHLPSHSRSPNSLPVDQIPNLEWQSVYAIIKNWRTYWTSNGVSDTALYFKPQ
jgi:predicted O-methyltransferase YrrM